MPLVSVIVPTFNRPIELSRAIKSIELQTLKDFEIIVVNDGGAIPLPKYPKQLKSVLYVNEGSNLGPAAARNKGIAQSDSKYVAYLDDDDEWMPDHLDVLIKRIKREKSLVYSTANILENGIHVRYWGNVVFNKFIADGFHTIFPLSACMHTRDLFGLIGVFDEKPFLIGPEDCEFLIRASDIVNPIATRYCSVTMHRDISMTRKPRLDWVNVLEYVIKKHSYGICRNNWLMFYRAFIAATNEKRGDLVIKWSHELDKQLPSKLTRSGLFIFGDYNISPEGIKYFCRQVLEDDYAD